MQSEISKAPKNKTKPSKDPDTQVTFMEVLKELFGSGF